MHEYGMVGGEPYGIINRLSEYVAAMAKDGTARDEVVAG